MLSHRIARPKFRRDQRIKLACRGLARLGEGVVVLAGFFGDRLSLHRIQLTRKSVILQYFWQFLRTIIRQKLWCKIVFEFETIILAEFKLSQNFEAGVFVDVLQIFECRLP